MGNAPFSVLHVGSFHIRRPLLRQLSIKQQQPEVTLYKALQPSLPEGSASHTWAGHLGDTIVYFKTFYFGCLRLALDDVGASCLSNFPALNFKANRNVSRN